MTFHNIWLSSKELKTKCYFFRNNSPTHFRDSLGIIGGIIIVTVRKLGHKLKSGFVSFLERMVKEVLCQKTSCFFLNNLIFGEKMNRKLYCLESWLKGEPQNHSTLQGNAFNVTPWSQLMNWKRTGKSGHQGKPVDGQLQLNPFQAQTIGNGEECVKTQSRHQEQWRQQQKCLFLLGKKE